MSKHPTQPLVKDDEGRLRFKQNKIVRFLKDQSKFDLNTLHDMPFDTEDWVQFNQLIGYSLDGWAELSYVSDEDYKRATKGLKK
jgi:hypothetical protein